MSLIKRAKVPVRAQEADSGGLYFHNPKENIEFFSSGCTLLDCAIGGGWPLGRISNVVGDKSTGKTLLAIEAMTNFARKYPTGEILYIEAESAFESDYAEALGLPIKRVKIEDDIDTVEGLFERTGEFVGVDLEGGDEEEKKSKKKVQLRTTPGLLIVDSLDALSDSAEMSRAIDKGSFGAAKAKMLSQYFRRLVRPLGRTKTHVMIVSQVRDAIGVTFGDKMTRSGGKALDFYASQALWLALLKTNNITRSGVTRAVSLHIRARCKKNKVGIPLREAEFDIRFGYGIEDIEANLEFLKKIGQEKLAPAAEAFKKVRGAELTTMRRALETVVVREWYEFEKNFVAPTGKYV